MDNQQFYLPSTLDDPERLLCWTVDECVVGLLPLIGGFLSSYPVTGLCLSPIALWLYRRVQQPDGIEGLRARLYWHSTQRFSHYFPVISAQPRDFIG